MGRCLRTMFGGLRWLDLGECLVDVEWVQAPVNESNPLPPPCHPSGQTPPSRTPPPPPLPPLRSRSPSATPSTSSPSPTRGRPPSRPPSSGSTTWTLATRGVARSSSAFGWFPWCKGRGACVFVWVYLMDLCVSWRPRTLNNHQNTHRKPIAQGPQFRAGPREPRRHRGAQRRREEHAAGADRG